MLTLITNIIHTLSPTGGLSYHYMAMKYSKNLWRKFQQELVWLTCDWSPSKKTLLLIGPSGGYSLSPQFFAPFETVVVFEPDPMARKILKRKIPVQILTIWEKSSPFFGVPKHSENIFKSLVEKYPNSAILFCNCIGQWPLITEVTEQDMAQFAKLLEEYFPKSWASYHDLFSGEVSSKKVLNTSARLTHPLKSIEEVTHFWKNLGGEEITDHLTFGQFTNGHRRTHLLWPLTKSQTHLIEWING